MKSAFACDADRDCLRLGTGLRNHDARVLSTAKRIQILPRPVIARREDALAGSPPIRAQQALELVVWIGIHRAPPLDAIPHDYARKLRISLHVRGHICGREVLPEFESPRQLAAAETNRHRIGLHAGIYRQVIVERYASDP